MVILALDQATLTGYAVVNEQGEILDSGTWQLADRKRTGESRGMRYIRFEANLRRAIIHWKPSLIVHEQTLLRGGAATEIANGFKALILKEAADLNVEVSCVHTSELKHWATGNGKAEKEDMVQAAMGFLKVRSATGKTAPRDDNEADAICIGLWAAERYGTFQGPKWPEKKKTPKRRKRSSGSFLDEIHVSD
jgi:Holliday junction resolvasome RuvABC endonuclease subunit